MPERRWAPATRGLATALALCSVLGACAGAGGTGGGSLSPARTEQQNVLTETLARMTRTSEARHDYATAAQQYARLLETDPHSEDYLLGMARNLRYAGQPRDAVTVLRRATAKGVAQETLDLRLELTRAMLAAGLLQDAAGNLQALRADAPGDGRILSLAGILADRQGHHAEAQDLYRQALTADPENLMVANNLALSLAISGRLEQATRLQERTVRSGAATVQMRQNLALFYALAGDMERAEQITRGSLPDEYADQVITELRALQGGAGTIPVPAVQGAPGSS